MRLVALRLQLHVELDDVGIDRRPDIHAVGRAQHISGDVEADPALADAVELGLECRRPAVAARRQRADDGRRTVTRALDAGRAEADRMLVGNVEDGVRLEEGVDAVLPRFHAGRYDRDAHRGAGETAAVNVDLAVVPCESSAEALAGDAADYEGKARAGRGYRIAAGGVAQA